MYQNISLMGAAATPALTQYDENAAMGILQHLNQQELQQLLDDEIKLAMLISDLQQVKAIQLEKETLLTSNKSLADYNLSREQKFKQCKEQLAQTYEEAIKIQKTFDEHKQKLQYSTEQHSLGTTLALLQTEVAKAEEQSEDVAEVFLEGNMEIDDFIDSFTKQRSLAHMRKVKVDKMQEIIRNRQQPHRAAAVRRAPAPAPPPNRWAGGGGLPYPVTANYAMPDPSAYMPR